MRAGDSSYAITCSAAAHRARRGSSPLLGSLDVELTERCNNDCLHCCINLPAGDRESRDRELTTGQWQTLFGEAAALGALSVRFTGGEPLLRPDFEDLYLAARRLGMTVVVFTNARLVTPQVADLLARVPPLESVEVSVYGMSELSYDAVARAPGAHAQFARGVQTLLDRGISFVVKGTVLPPNRDEVDRFESWAATLPGMDSPPGYSLLLDLRTRRDSEARNELIRSLRSTPREFVGLLSRRRAHYVDEMRRFCTRFLAPPDDRLFGCGAGHGVCIDAYGSAQACLPLRHPDTVVDLRNGDGVRRGALKEVLTEIFPRLRALRAGDPEYLRRCARCFLRGLCEQCPAKSWSEHGTLDTPVEYLCEVAHAQARDLGLLRPEERSWEIESWEERIAWIG